VLGSTTTDGSGNFSFSGAETACPSGQQAYIVAAGGNTNGNTTNSAALLMAALGPCANLVEGSGSSATKVVIDEPTTIAAAYALSGFMTVNGTTVNISAPANNNAATATCTVVANATTACVASGLAHAFLNAATLVNSSTGAVNSTVTTGATVTASVPQMHINTLANTVEACINSSGSTSAACTTLMTNTTPTALVSSPTAPTNTLQALLDLAQYPSEAANPTAAGTGTPPNVTGGPAASTATTNLFNLANSNAYYAPALTAAPFDFTIAINYVLAPGGTVQAPWGLATDIADNVYMYAAATPPVIYSLTSNGGQNWSTATTEASAGGCATGGTRCGVIPDTLGNLWVTDNKGLTELNTVSGALGTTFPTVEVLTDATVDLGNNVWATAVAVSGGTGTQTTPSDLEELPRGASAIVDVQVSGAVLAGFTPLRDPAFDSAGNLWAASGNIGGGAPGALLMISNNNSLTAPDFSYAATANPEIIAGGGGSNLTSMAPQIDASGNVWIGAELELNEITSSGTETGGAQSYAQSMTLTYGSNPWDSHDGRNLAMDGDGKIVVDGAAGNQGYVSVYYPNAPSDGQGGTGLGGANVYLNPCFIATATTVCAEVSDGGSLIVNAARSSVIDASGAIWTSLSSGKNVIQLFGPGAPTWSQSSYIPKALAPNLTNTATTLRPY